MTICYCPSYGKNTRRMENFHFFRISMLLSPYLYDIMIKWKQIRNPVSDYKYLYKRAISGGILFLTKERRYYENSVYRRYS